MRSALLVLVLAFGCSGCFGSKLREQQKQLTADAAAGVYEAAVAIEHGADSTAPLTAIKASAAAIIKTQDRTYAPADTWAAQMKAPAPPAPNAGAPK